MPSRRVAGLFLSVLSCLCTAFGPPVITDSDVPRQSLTLDQMRAVCPIPTPDVTAASAILVSPTTGQILFAHNEHERRAPASLVKIVTALVALQRGRQDQELRVNRGDLQLYSAARVWLGENLNVRKSLFLLLIPSDNVAAMTLARGLAGDVDTYVQWMNELVASWGLVDTHFVNPHGLDAEGAYTTAYDMAIIARYAMRDAIIAEIVGCPEAIIDGRRVESTNKLLNAYPGAIGMKTGTTDRAGECLIAVVDRPSGQALSVVLGADDRVYDTRLLLDYFYATCAELRIDLPQTPQNRYLDENGDWHEIRMRDPITFLVSPWQVGTASFYRRIDDVSANPDLDKPVGALEVTLAGQRLAEVPLYVR